MSKKRELANNILIIGLGRMLYQGVSLALIPVYTHYLTPQQYGLYDLLVSYIMLSAPVLSMQLDMAAFRLIISYRQKSKKQAEVVSTIMFAVLTIVTLVEVVAVALDALLPITLNWLILAYLATFTFSNLLQQIARGYGKSLVFAISNSIMAIVLPLSVLILVILAHAGIDGLLIALSAAHLGAIIYLIFSIKLHKTVAFSKFRIKLLNDALRYSLPLVPNGASLWVINMSDRTIISILLGTAANGIYAIASKVPLIYNSFFNIFYISWIESASAHINADKDHFISSVLNAAIIAFSCLGVILIAVTPILFPFLISPQFADSYRYIPLLIMSTVLGSVVSLYGSVYIALRRTNGLMVTTAILAIINLSISLLLTKSLGLFGPIVSMIISYLIIASYRYYDLRKHVYLSFELSSAIMVAILYAVVTITYYTNSLLLQLFSLLSVAIGVVWLNKSGFRYLQKEVIQRRQVSNNEEIPQEQS